jgi:hypothetical protein
MASTFICTHCRKRTKKNVRIKKGQHYCGSRACQQDRKNTWDRERIQNDKDYADARIESKKKWRKKPDGHLSVYQRKYRENHPDYVNDNRAKRLKQYHEKKLFDAKKNVVKTDALSLERPIPSGVYALFPYRADAFGKTSEHFVKTDALIVQLTGLQQNAAQLHSN